MLYSFTSPNLLENIFQLRQSMDKSKDNIHNYISNLSIILQL